MVLVYELMRAKTRVMGLVTSAKEKELRAGRCHQPKQPGRDGAVKQSTVNQKPQQQCCGLTTHASAVVDVSKASLPHLARLGWCLKVLL